MPRASNAHILVAASALLIIGCGSDPADDDGATAGSGGAGGGSTSSNGGGGAGGADSLPGVDTTVTPFEATHFYFTGDDNKRVNDAEATFPDEGLYERIILHVSLDCPDGGCDPWDRVASLGIVSAKGTNGEPDTEIELARFITPFHVKAAWDIDVTDLRPLLSGTVTLRGFIDTWVGPGSPYGDGWLLTASFEMTGGVPEKRPVAVIPVWNRTSVIYGDPAKAIPGQVPAAEVTLPAGASSFALRSLITGHGQGNADNCAEFCDREHTLTVGTAAHTQLVWRDDCETTAAPNQQGTWQYPRAGWCPGADVLPWIVDVTADISGGGSATFGYDVEAYENTCRPDSAVCTGCTLGTSCEYDGGAHTEPNYQVSTLLIAYE
ncbi:MAG: hypothetical protein HOW73_15565 [Polyangiaceae bacterium]|nr:hypothetical protein [Polyangiaceae bacterium]